MRAGWGRSAIYKQVVKLPSAQYRLEYWAINMNPNATRGENMSKVTWQDGEIKDTLSLTNTEWTLHAIEFTPTSEFTIEVGFKADGGSGANPFLCIDDVKLFRVGESIVDTINQPIYIETDLTAQFSSLTDYKNWIGATGAVGWAAPAVTTNTGQSVATCERYETSCDRTGDIMYTTLSGLTPGIYKIELYGAAAFTYGRGFGSTAFTGDLSVDTSETYQD